MLPTSEAHPRGRRVREFVCSYRPLRNDDGQAVQLPPVALTDPKVPAATLAPLLAGEAVDVFAVACPVHASSSPRLARAVARPTVRLAEAADVLDIALLDHLSVGDDGRYFSFRESGLVTSSRFDGSCA